MQWSDFPIWAYWLAQIINSFYKWNYLLDFRKIIATAILLPTLSPHPNSYTLNLRCNFAAGLLNQLIMAQSTNNRKIL
jgi:hypothetical protein